jgi:hypothetical protein
MSTKTLLAMTVLVLTVVAGAVAFVSGDALPAPEATVSATPTPERFWTDNICPQDVTAPPVTCTFLRTEGSTIRMPLIDPTGYTYGMILIDAGRVTLVQATATPAAPVQPTATAPVPSSLFPPCGLSYIVVDLNNDSADVISRLPYDTYCQWLGLYTATQIIQYRGTQGYQALSDLLRVPGITPEIVGAIRACQCTGQR